MDINSDVFLQDKGLLLYKSGKFTEAIATWELAAAKGNANSMFGLGIAYLTDSCLDEEKARIWFKRAYLAGHSKAGKKLKTMDLGRAQIVNDYTSFKIDDFEKNTGVKSQYLWYNSESFRKNLGGLYGLQGIS
jgi:TPR repeat protein